jgi:transcriptional regulator with XRE-family HTH domain
MRQAGAIADVLKAELKSRGLTYAQIAAKIQMSEASVKRMFSQRSFTLERIDQICQASGIEFSELMARYLKGFDHEAKLITRLTDAQEREIVNDSKLFLTAVCALNLLRFEDILALYQVTEAELIGLLAKLDKIGFIELLPNNRIKLKVARTFAWIPNGPIMTTFKENTADFFDSDFSGSNQVMLLLNGRLNQANAAALVEKLRQLARDFSERHIEDSSLPVAQRESMSLLLACRPWHFSAMKEWSRSDNTKKKHKLR